MINEGESNIAEQYASTISSVSLIDEDSLKSEEEIVEKEVS